MQVKNIICSLLLISITSQSLVGCNSGGGSVDSNWTTNSGTELKYTKEHDNDVYFYNLDNIDSISFSETGHSIRSGQPYDGVGSSSGSDKNKGDYLKLRVKAGRKADSKVGDDFKNSVAGHYAITSDNDDVHKNTNFYTYGSLYINGDPIKGPVHIAQFSSGSRNAWAFGNINAKNGPDRNSLTIYSYNDHPYCIYHYRDKYSIEEWAVADGDCSTAYDPKRGRGIHDNELRIYRSSDIESIGIVPTGEFEIPPSQPYDGVNVSEQEAENYGVYTSVIIKAGRHHEGWVGADFINKAKNYAVTSDYDHDVQDKSNFFVANKMSINGDPVKGNVYFLQYQTSNSSHIVYVQRNGWGIGNEYAKAGPNHNSFTLFTTHEGEDIPYCFFHNGAINSIEEFDIVNGDCNEVYNPGKENATLRSNQVFLSAYDGSGKVLPITYSYLGSKVTEAQPSLNNLNYRQITTDSDSALMVEFLAGRHKSKDVAKAFASNLGNSSSHIIRTVSKDTKPSRLNFYIDGKLSIDGSEVANSVYLAQGHRSTTTTVLNVLGTLLVSAGVKVMKLRGEGYDGDNRCGVRSLAFILISTGLGLIYSSSESVANDWWVGSNSISSDVIHTSNGRCYKVSSKKDDSDSAAVNRFFFRETSCE